MNACVFLWSDLAWFVRARTLHRRWLLAQSLPAGEIARPSDAGWLAGWLGFRFSISKSDFTILWPPCVSTWKENKHNQPVTTINAPARLSESFLDFATSDKLPTDLPARLFFSTYSINLQFSLSFFVQLTCIKFIRCLSSFQDKLSLARGSQSRSLSLEQVARPNRSIRRTSNHTGIL